MLSKSCHTRACHANNGQDATNVAMRLALAKQSCQQRGLRFTALREQVFEVILQANAPIGAYDILAKLQQQQLSHKPSISSNEGVVHQSLTANTVSKTIAPPTVYRSLEFLLTHGFIHQLNSVNAFIPCCHPRDNHRVAFLICQPCGKVEEFSADSIDNMLATVQNQANFRVQTSIIEIIGVCQTCQHLDI